MEDSELIAQTLGANPAAYNKLVERYQRQLYFYVIGKVAVHAEAQDLVQKSFVTAFQSLDQFQRGAAFFPWVKGIALNHCRNEWRRYHRHSAMQERLLEARRAELEMVWLEERHEESEARLAALRECLQKLSPQEQELVDRRFVQELSMAAIGSQLSKGSEAVRLMLFRVRTRLADCVKRRMSVNRTLETA